MGPRMTRVTAMVAVLLLGVLTAPAAAQDADDEIDVDTGERIEGVTALQCAVGVAQANADLNPGVFDDRFAAFFGVDAYTAAARGLSEDDVASDEQQRFVDVTAHFLAEQGQTLSEVCSIYIIGVLPDVGDPDPDDDDEVDDTVDVDVEVVADDEEDVAPAVLGTTLQRTGVDALVLALFGAVLLGLGVVAVRRTRVEYGAR